MLTRTPPASTGTRSIAFQHVPLGEVDQRCQLIYDARGIRAASGDLCGWMATTP